MIFFTGLHHPSDAHRFDHAFVSANRLWERRSDFQVNQWIMDSGAFSEILQHGKYRSERSVDEYAKQVLRWKRCGIMRRAVTQDYMCEPDMLERTGMSVAEHQRLTIDRYLALHALCGEIIMPCLQGQVIDDYVQHLAMYGDILSPGAWVGVGSVCKRKNENYIGAILRSILQVRPDLRLHGFGLKISALRCADVWDMLYSADSMAWSYAARMAGRDGNSWLEAAKFTARINTMARQESLQW